VHDPASWFRKTWLTRRRVRELKNAHNSVTVQNRTHVYMTFFHHKDLGNHILQLCPKVVKRPVLNNRINRHVTTGTFLYLQFLCFKSGYCGLEVSVLASGTQVRGFKPDRSHRIFRAKKILSTPSFGGEVKPVGNMS